jgi:uncharacterized protein involved in exopolysaccharide biosynthesis
MPWPPLIGHERGVTARDVLLFLWRSRWLTLLAVAVLGGGAAIAAWTVTPRYTATVEVMPINNAEMGLGGSGSALTQLGGLASLAGLSLGGSSAAKDEALATLQSEELTDKYIQQHDLMPILFWKAWNPKTRTWRHTDPRRIPTLWDANQVFKSIRVVDDNVKTGVVKVSIDWKDPDQAAEWANGLVRLTNDDLRQKSIDEADRSIAYLNQAVLKTNIVEVRNAIYGLMEEEIKKEMVAEGRQDFALRVIDPAVPPQRPSAPRRFLWVAAGILAGLFLGLLASALREIMNDEAPSEGAAAEKRVVTTRAEGH